jgi:hypothetical protein
VILINKRKVFIRLGIIIVIGFILLQLLPVGSIRPILQRNANPAELTTVVWDSVSTQNLAIKACYDCHSNKTSYPWYSYVAPVSWLVTRDVNKGREAMNFSEDAPTDYNINDMDWHLHNDMPPKIYLIMHPDANLTDEEKELLLQGFRATFTEASDNAMNMGS